MVFDFWRFKQIDMTEYVEVSGEYNALLVYISIVIAVLAAYSALIILERVWATSKERISTVLLWCSAAVLGLGVWAMHFAGMLAFLLPIPTDYEPITTVVSILPALFGGYAGLGILAKKKFGFWWIQVGALSLALGIGLMHFVGMEAIRADIYMAYDFRWFVGSILVAHLLATIALTLIVMRSKILHSRLLWRVTSGFFIGLAIAGMHYTGMMAVSFHMPITDELFVGARMLTTSHIAMAIAITSIIILTFVVTVIGLVVERRLHAAFDSAAMSESTKKAVVENLADGLLVIDENGKIETFNRSGLEMFECDESILGKEIELIIPQITYPMLSDDSEKEEPEIIGKTIELQGQKTFGELFPMEITFSRMTISGNRMFNAIIRDISRRKELEEQLRQAQKLESIGQLAAGIAHEINTPTQYISDNTSFLKKAFGGMLAALESCQAMLDAAGDEESSSKAKMALKKAKIGFMSKEVPKAIDQSLDGLKRVATIVSAMKSFSHPSDGEKVPIDLKEAIEVTTTIARSEWKYVADIDYQFDDDLPEVPCLRDEFNQVVLNIVVNAAHAIEDTLDEHKTKGKITIATRLDGNFAEVLISDNGKGMPKSVQEKIFDPFFTTKDVGKGTGQGLSIAYSVIVEKHGGDLAVESQPGEGTTFTIRLPLIDQAQDEEETRIAV